MPQNRNNEDYTLIREASPLTAEMVAAVRAKTENTPEAKALVTFSGTVISNIFHVLAPAPVVNISEVRDLTMNYLVDKHLPADGQNRIFVDLACGYSSRGAVLARLRPDVTVYEIDLPTVINQKSRRYQRNNINLPENHRMISADMKMVALSELLDGKLADVVMARGLFIYFDINTISLAAQNVLTGLKPSGHFITDLVLGTDQSLGSFTAIINFIRKQTGSDASRGRVASKEEGEKLFLEAGYATSKAYQFSDFEEEIDLPKPYNNMMLVVESQRTAETQTTENQAVEKVDESIQAEQADDDLPQAAKVGEATQAEQAVDSLPQAVIDAQSTNSEDNADRQIVDDGQSDNDSGKDDNQAAANTPPDDEANPAESQDSQTAIDDVSSDD
ncbi:MAG: class I SAM-dependent methyltransferase [Anaerolineae bacterium]|nr:class I SAM-dependent methyltransferase [Anaerolineae bacterium]MDQ7036622.1 class I SAM-dependent methyltransferase [Anaerolineae bacterium]